MTMPSCPISTPRLKARSGRTTSSGGSSGRSIDAKPSPWMSPKRKVTTYRRGGEEGAGEAQRIGGGPPRGAAPARPGPGPHRHEKERDEKQDVVDPVKDVL